MTKKIKVNLTSTETNEEYYIDATINDNIIEYKEPDNTSSRLDRKENKLIRDNEKLHMEFHFCLNNITNNTIILKDLNYTLDVLIETKKITNELDKYLVEYEIINNDKFIYKIEIGDNNEHN